MQMLPHMSIKTFKQTSKLLIQFAHVQSCMCTEAADCSCPFFQAQRQRLLGRGKGEGRLERRHRGRGLPASSAVMMMMMMMMMMMLVILWGRPRMGIYCSQKKITIEIHRVRPRKPTMEAHQRCIFQAKMSQTIRN